MRILVLSDVHANLAALEAVLGAEPSVDRVFFLGDTVDYGPDPSGCIERLRAVAAAAVRGNHDNAVAFGVECMCSETFRELSRASREYTKSVLSPEEIAFLRGLSPDRTLDVEGRRFYLTHASPADNLFGYVSPEKDPERWQVEMDGAPADRDIILTGHTHRPYIRRLLKSPRSSGARVPAREERVVVNPGSVGQPRDGDPRAAYAVWERDHFELKRVDYDIELTVDRLNRTGQPPDIVAALVAVLRRGGLPPSPGT